MQNRKLQIFLSSTYEDLIDHRLAAMEAILAAGHIPAAMEQFSAGDDTAWERITRWIDASDAFILIVGGRYGSIEPTSGKSYVQLEYEYAVEKKKPYFALVINDAHLEKWVKQEGFKVDERDHRERYLEFKKQVKHKLCAPWEDKKDIKQAIFHKLPEWAERQDLVGWIRADEAAKPEVTNELAQLSQENRELRSRVENATYAGLGFAELCKMLSKHPIVPQNPETFCQALRLETSPRSTNLLALFESISGSFGHRRGPLKGVDQQADDALQTLYSSGLIDWTDGARYAVLTEDGKAFRNRLSVNGPDLPD